MLQVFYTPPPKKNCKNQANESLITYFGNGLQPKSCSKHLECSTLNNSSKCNIA